MTATAVRQNNHAAYRRKAVELEPDLITGYFDTFSLAVASDAQRIVTASWATGLTANFPAATNVRAEVRDPSRSMALCGATFVGLQANALALVMNPASTVGITNYDASPWDLYQDRLAALDALPLKVLGFVDAPLTTLAFLPGPYGAIIEHVTSYNYIGVTFQFQTGYGINLQNEIEDDGDYGHFRFSNCLMLAVNKTVCGWAKAHASPVNGTIDARVGDPSGSIAYRLLPSTWSKITDPLTYDFRDDFFGASLNTASTWTRVQSTVGNVEIVTAYQWCKVKGNENWGTNGLHTQAAHARVGVPILLVDVNFDKVDNDVDSGCFVGWFDGSNLAVADTSHCILFGAANVISIFEAGNNRGTVGAGWDAGCTYRVRITANANGSATYQIQGGDANEYGAIGGASWTTLTPGTASSGGPASIYPGASSYKGTSYLGDMRVY